MRAVLPGRPPAKFQALSTALWEELRVIAYISGHALVILGGAHKLLQTIYVDDTERLEAVAIDEASGRIAVCGGPDIFVYHPIGLGNEKKWSLEHTFRCEDDDEAIQTLSWGAQDELLAGNSNLALWFMTDTPPRQVWKRKLANPVKFAQFSSDAGVVASAGAYDRMLKVWRRLTFGANDVRFEVSYLPHPASVTGIHWRRPLHREQTMENVLYTFCADNKIRVWASIDPHGLSALQLWAEIDMDSSIQPRLPIEAPGKDRRYGFVIDSRDFSAATERAVQRSAEKGADNFALEHLIEIANKSPEICVVLDGWGHMSAWGLENVGCKVRSETNVFNILHIEGLNLAFAADALPEEDYTQFCAFGGGASEDSITVLAHHFDGRIEWFDSKVDVLFDPAPRLDRLSPRGSWCGHEGPIKKIVRNASGKILMSRTDDNNGIVWKQQPRRAGPVLARQSTISSEEHIHRTCVVGDSNILINLHHNAVSVWDTRSFHAQRLAINEFRLSSKPLCVLHLQTSQRSERTAYIAAIGADMKGIAWEVDLPHENGQTNGVNGIGRPVLRQFCTFDLRLTDEDISYILPIDPAGQKARVSEFLDPFAADIALSYSHDGNLRTWAAKVDERQGKIDWLLTSTVETGIPNPSLASGSSIRKAAIVDQDRAYLTIWDTSSAQLEFEEHFAQHDVIRDLDWVSTPDDQSILAVGFPHKVVLLSQLRYDYMDSGPSWAQIREIRIRDLTPHPIGDSCWLGNGNLVVGAGNQLFVYDKDVEATNPLVTELRLPSHGAHLVDLFEAVARLNGPLSVFHPQFLSQCILSGKTSLVHLILMTLHRKLKFFTEGDPIDNFLDISLEEFLRHTDAPGKDTWKKLEESYADLSLDDESHVVDENVATLLVENLTRVALPQLSSREQFRLVDIIECVAMVEKHRRSMDDNAARYLLFFRQHMMRKSQGVSNKTTVSWREIVWAFHSGSQDILTDLASRQFHGKMLWENARESGIFMWMTDLNALRAQLETVARNEYTKTEEKNPIDCSLYYLALRKKNVLQGLWRMASWNREQATTQRFLANNFQEPRWKTAALKNAYALLGKRRFEYAAAFFLLAGNLRDAAFICMNQLGDIQLAIAITRAYEGDDGPVLKEILEERVLLYSTSEGNRWLATWTFWMLKRRDMAVRALVSPIETLIPPTPASPGSPGSIPIQAKSYLANDPALVTLYRQLREKTLQTLKGASKVPPRAEWEFVLRNARLYDRMGCDLLALDLVRNWDFLRPQPSTIMPTKSQLGMNMGFMEDAPDPRKLLRRRSSMVVADLPLSPTGMSQADFKKIMAGAGAAPGKPGKPPPTVFEEPDSSSLLDSFGF